MNKHLLTAKHKMARNTYTTRDEQILSCECGKIYKHRQSLYNHKKRCNVPMHIETTNAADQFSETSKTDLSSMVHTLIKENQEFKQLMVDQSKQIMELSSLPRTITNNNTTNNNNQKFNLNFFLNTTCKDAMNMSDFIRNMEVQMSELENIGHRGYIAGMTDLILNKLKGLDVSKRPMHCTDLKRETMYIKDQDRWDKDNADKGQLRRAISLVAKKNYGKTLEWRELNPECLEIGSEKYDFCFNMMRNVLGDFEEEQIKLDNKVIKNLAKEVIVGRDTLSIA